MALIGRSIATMYDPSLSIPVQLSSSLILIHQLGGNSVQVTLGDLSDLNSFITLDQADIKKIHKIRRKHGFYMVVHGKYIYNFCRATWHEKLAKALLNELTIAHQIGCDVVIHQGKNVATMKIERSEALENYIKGIKLVISHMRENGLNNRIILENSAAQGTELGYSLSEISVIWHSFTAEEQQHLGICIDTCHAFVAGELDFGDPTAVETWIESFDQSIGLEHLRVVHFNGSAVQFGGKNDHHARLDDGHSYIRKAGLKRLASICGRRRIPLIMETPNGENVSSEIELIKSWLG